MKPSIGISLVVLSFFSCSTPRYVYYFDHQTPRAKADEASSASQPVIPAPDPLSLMTGIAPTFYPANAVNFAVLSKKATTILPERSSGVKQARGKRAQEMRVGLPTGRESTMAINKMDKHLKMSIIFEASGIVMLIIGGAIFWVLGALCALVGLILFIKWLLRP